MVRHANTSNKTEALSCGIFRKTEKKNRKGIEVPFFYIEWSVRGTFGRWCMRARAAPCEQYRENAGRGGEGRGGWAHTYGRSCRRNQARELVTDTAAAATGGRSSVGALLFFLYAGVNLCREVKQLIKSALFNREAAKFTPLVYFIFLLLPWYWWSLSGNTGKCIASCIAGQAGRLRSRRQLPRDLHPVLFTCLNTEASHVIIGSCACGL